MSDNTITKANGSGGSVTVACKLPNGLQLRLFKMEPFTEPVVGGGMRETKIAVQVGDVVHIHGYSTPFGGEPKARVVGKTMAALATLNGYALTPGVPRDFFDEWLKQNKDSDVVKNKLIFAAEGVQEAESKAKELTKVKSGLEAIDPNNLPRMSRTLKIEKYDGKETVA